MNHDVDTPALYREVMAELETSDGVTFNAIGVVAWERLSGEQRREALPLLLGAYALTCFEEERVRQRVEAAEDPTRTYLGDHDTALLWDSVGTPANQFDEVPADINALRNVMCELELLQHRLAMRDAERPAA